MYVLIYGDPTAAVNAPAAREDAAILHGLLARVAQAGWLRVGVAQAARLLAAAGSGVTFTLIATLPGSRGSELADAMREAVFSAIIAAPTADDAPEGVPGAARVAARAVALRSVLAEASGVLSLAEQDLLDEWLDRLADAKC